MNFECPVRFTLTSSKNSAVNRYNVNRIDTSYYQTSQRMSYKSKKKTKKNTTFK